MSLACGPATNECQVLCSICGGECCRTKPGIEGPERFTKLHDPVRALADLLASGLWVLDEHLGTYLTFPGGNGELTILYPRPATTAERKAGPLTVIPGSGECVFLAAEGCRLPFGERPRMCRELVPEVNFECHADWTRRDAADAWLPWQDTVRAALELLGRKR